jgi:UDP-glucose 4-epimerase
MRYVVTGGAGFIGSHVVDALLLDTDTREAVVVDYLSGGEPYAVEDPRHRRIRIDLRTEDPRLAEAAAGADLVIHLAANVDMRRGITDTACDVQQHVVATHRLLQAMRVTGARRLVFASSSAVYGEARRVPTRADDGPYLPISLYGAGKLGAEGLIAAAAHLDEVDACILRFGNVVGPRISHGVIHDFVHRLRANSRVLDVLGDGGQRKTFFDVQDCVAGILQLWRRVGPGCHVVNLGSGSSLTVSRIAEIVLDVMGLRGVEIRYAGGRAGWPGDVPVVELDIDRARSLGWHPRRDDEAAVRRCTEWVAARADRATVGERSGW